jgi:uncharacterized protein (DUF58 family)
MRWYVGSVLLLLAALLLQSGLLAYAMYVLLGLLVVTRFLARNWVAQVTAVRAGGDQVAEIDERVSVVVSIRNTGWMPVPWLLVEDLLPAATIRQKPAPVEVQGDRLRLLLLWGGQKVTLRYSMTPKQRGYYQVGPLLLESGDLFGLHRRYRMACPPQFVLVYPRVVPLIGYDITSRRPIGDVRLTHRLFEDPTRLGGVRPYEIGDPLNRVHWRATARTGQLHSKVCEPSTLAGATFLLDFHIDGYSSRSEPARSDLAVTALCSLANAVWEMGQQIGLVTNGRDAADRIRQEGWTGQPLNRRQAQVNAGPAEENDRLRPLLVPTQRGSEQLQRLRDMLARVEKTDGLTCAQLISETAARMPRDATVVAILPDASVETALALGNLRRRGFAVTAVLIQLDSDPFERAFGRLCAERIEVRHLPNADALPWLCQGQVDRSAPYQFAVQLD